MSCKDTWGQTADRAAGQAFVARAGVTGAATCIRVDCDAVINQATGQCAQGHSQGAEGLAYPLELGALLCAAGELGSEWQSDSRVQAGRRILGKLVAGGEEVTAAVSEVGPAMLTALESMIASRVIRDPEGDHYGEVLSALSDAYMDYDLDAHDLEVRARARVREGLVARASELPPPAAASMQAVLESLTAHQLIERGSDVHEQAMQALAEVYGDPGMDTAEIWEWTRRLLEKDGGKRYVYKAGTQAIHSLLTVFDDLRDQGEATWEEDPRVQAARTFLDGQEPADKIRVLLADVLQFFSGVAEAQSWDETDDEVVKELEAFYSQPPADPRSTLDRAREQLGLWQNTSWWAEEDDLLWERLGAAIEGEGGAGSGI